jgi:hypothetical protein
MHCVGSGILQFTGGHLDCCGQSSVLLGCFNTARVAVRPHPHPLEPHTCAPGGRAFPGGVARLASTIQGESLPTSCCGTRCRRRPPANHPPTRCCVFWPHSSALAGAGLTSPPPPCRALEQAHAQYVERLQQLLAARGTTLQGGRPGLQQGTVWLFCKPCTGPAHSRTRSSANRTQAALVDNPGFAYLQAGMRAPYADMAVMPLRPRAALLYACRRRTRGRATRIMPSQLHALRSPAPRGGPGQPGVPPPQHHALLPSYSRSLCARWLVGRH